VRSQGFLQRSRGQGQPSTTVPGHGKLSLVPVALVFLGLIGGAPGCASFVDDVTSRDFDVKNLFVKPNPLAVLKNSSDGNQRAKALRSLREPPATGEFQKEHELYVQILTTAATKDAQPLCRLAAIKSLGTFKDPRAAEALDKAFLETNQFTPETNNIIRQQALAALGKVGGRVARNRLVLVAREPPTAPNTTEQEKQEALDLRLTAVRALAHFSTYDVAETLVKILKTEKDVAMRDRAHESLVVVTGKHLPPDAKEWDDLLHQKPNVDGTLVKDPPKGLLRLVSCWQ
jgi:HEAT repeat protein